MAPVRYSVPFSPLTERIALEAPQLAAALAELRSVMGEADFERYINTLVSLRQVDDQLLLITKREMYRSILLSRFLPAIKQCFAVRLVRIINQ
ncbi:hypothetical protein [Sporomusa termitida]|uniref:Uncharacterized protein n=1 Tax=Sporomusa termitida TaxID=2377 RepID=A0A517DYX6_9FIRM|nr:hypothetical protein [Sporomusa termitida]QDR82528.1 hypothetical protein SPTER_39560 [Sporomusa termitida]